MGPVMLPSAVAHRQRCSRLAVSRRSSGTATQRRGYKDCVCQSVLGANAPELKSGLGFDNLAVHFKERISEEINRSAFRFRIDHQIPTLGQFKPISRIMTKIVISELWVLPRFTDVYWYPTIVCEKFGPAMIALDLALILVSWNGRADDETRGYVNASRQSDEVRVEITTIAGADIARIDGVSATPTST